MFLSAFILLFSVLAMAYWLRDAFKIILHQRQI